MAIAIDLSQKTFLVTGATGGIGKGIVAKFVAAGANVIAHYAANSEAAAELEAAHPNVVTLQADLSQESEIEALMDKAGSRFEGLDGVINNAALQYTKPLIEVKREDWHEMFEINVSAVHDISRIFAQNQKSGSITHIASIEGSYPAVNHGHYAASKAAVVMHAKAAALEWGTAGVRVNTVSPGLITREGIEQQWPEGVKRWKDACPLDRLGTPEDIANACLFLASPLAAWITGQNLNVDGGLTSGPGW